MNPVGSGTFCFRRLLTFCSTSSIDISSVQFSRSVVSDSLRPHESQHSRPPCPSPSPGVHSDSRPSSQWCHPAISFSVVPFSSCPQSLPASESFPMSQLFAWGGQSTGVRYSPTQIIYFFFCEFWQVMFFEEFIHFIQVIIKFEVTEFFIVFFYYLFWGMFHFLQCQS